MSDAETPDPHAGVGEDPTIDDVGDLNQRQRLKSIDETRQRALEMLGELTAAESRGYSEADAAVALHAVVKAHLVNIEQLMRSHGSAELTSQPLGEITIQPPDSIELRGTSDTVDLSDHRVQLQDTQDLEPATATVTGVLPSEDNEGTAYLSLPSRLRQHWSVKVNVKHDGLRVAEGRAASPVPRRISESAFRLSEQFLHEFGLDARLDEGRPFGDYS
jgi:hypothetical protein